MILMVDTITGLSLLLPIVNSDRMEAIAYDIGATQEGTCEEESEDNQILRPDEAHPARIEKLYLRRRGDSDRTYGRPGFAIRGSGTMQTHCQTLRRRESTISGKKTDGVPLE
jgi:hypothetical protein